MPQVIEDSIQVRLTLNVPHLWVDLYGIGQNDSECTAFDIRGMGHMYQRSLITSAAGLNHQEGLYGKSRGYDIGQVQRIENIRRRKCRIAFFGGHDVVYMCGTKLERVSTRKTGCRVKKGTNLSLPTMVLVSPPTPYLTRISPGCRTGTHTLSRSDLPVAAGLRGLHSPCRP